VPGLLQAALLGIVQGLTEFLPVSSTAHLLICGRLIGYDDPGGVFTVMIQAGSILAIGWVYRAKIVQLVTGLPSRPEARRFVLMVVAAAIPLLSAGLLFSGFIKTVLYGNFRVIAMTFVLGGVIILVVERFRAQPTVGDVDSIPMGRAVGVGMCQTLALIPGVSRSGATIIGGLLLGLARPAAAEFSFFLAMPALLAAFAHDLLEVWNHIGPGRTLEIIVGFVMAFFASVLVVKPFLSFVGRSGFGPFAWYRIVAGALIFGALAGGWM
jgi:undecaprenyl-diphosphatase